MQSDACFKELVKIIKDDVNRIWTTSLFVQEYSLLCLENNALDWTKRWLIERINNHFGDNLICLSSPGLENMYAFKNHASQILAMKNLVDNEDYVSEAINKVGKIISDELAKDTR